MPFPIDIFQTNWYVQKKQTCMSNKKTITKNDSYDSWQKLVNNIPTNKFPKIFQKKKKIRIVFAKTWNENILQFAANSKNGLLFSFGERHTKLIVFEKKKLKKGYNLGLHHKSICHHSKL